MSGESQTKPPRVPRRRARHVLGRRRESASSANTRRWRRTGQRRGVRPQRRMPARVREPGGQHTRRPVEHLRPGRRGERGPERWHHLDRRQTRPGHLCGVGPAGRDGAAAKGDDPHQPGRGEQRGARQPPCRGDHRRPPPHRRELTPRRHLPPLHPRDDRRAAPGIERPCGSRAGGGGRPATRPAVRPTSGRGRWSSPTRVRPDRPRRRSAVERQTG